MAKQDLGPTEITNFDFYGGSAVLETRGIQNNAICFFWFFIPGTVDSITHLSLQPG